MVATRMHTATETTTEVDTVEIATMEATITEEAVLPCTHMHDGKSTPILPFCYEV